jgi:Na+-translocating ferredoxin:NAD+ oxidoreductase RnfG subunit
MKYSILIILTSFLAAGDIKISCEEHLSNLYPVDTDFSMHILLLDKQVKKKVENKVKQKFYRDKLYYWNITKGDSTMAYAFLDNVIGKSMPITFLVILNMNGNIINTNVIKYREAYGGEVGNTGWLQQFYTRNNNSRYKIGKDIDGISGATISVKSMSKGLQKITALYPLIKNQLK